MTPNYEEKKSIEGMAMMFWEVWSSDGHAKWTEYKTRYEKEQTKNRAANGSDTDQIIVSPYLYQYFPTNMDMNMEIKWIPKLVLIFVQTDTDTNRILSISIFILNRNGYNSDISQIHIFF